MNHSQNGLQEYQGYYINLTHSKDRRVYIKNHLKKLGLQPHFKRFKAVNGATQKVPENSNLSPCELACYESHLGAFSRALDIDKHLHIIEDDVLICKNFKSIVKAFLARQTNQEWDIIFLGTNISLIQEIYDAIDEQNFSVANMVLTDLAGWGDTYAGSHSYLVNKASIAKVARLLPSKKYDLAFDLALRYFIKTGELRGYILLPLLCIPQVTFFEGTIADRDIEEQHLTKEHFHLASQLFFIDADHQEVYAKLIEYLYAKHNLVTKKPINNPTLKEVVDFFMSSLVIYRKK